jgi:hypothetical protein
MGDATAPPSALAGLSQLSLLSDSARNLFLPAVAESLLAAPGGAAAASLREAFGLDFAAAGSAAEALLHAAKLLLCGVAARGYVANELHAELLAAGLGEGAAAWVREAAEAAVQTCGAGAIRTAQVHAMASAQSDYLHDFDWSVYHVLGSSSLAHVQTPLVQLHLQIAKPQLASEVVTESLERTADELDATLKALSAASDALRTLPPADQ